MSEPIQKSIPKGAIPCIECNAYGFLWYFPFSLREIEALQKVSPNRVVLKIKHECKKCSGLGYIK